MPLPFFLPLELAFFQKLELGDLSFFVFFLGARGKWQQPEDVAVAEQRATQNGRSQNTPKDRVTCAHLVHPFPEEEPIRHQERQC